MLSPNFCRPISPTSAHSLPAISTSAPKCTPHLTYYFFIMGVPALFRWLSTKYPKIISPVVEDAPDEQFGKVPQFSDPNPNGELDNLYLDMNGIVHPCSHPEHKPAPETEDEMFLDVFKYTDRVLMMARPRKVLMIAVDGVAPRAKMNQQRARRFRAAQDAKIANEEKERQIKEFEARGEVIDDAVKGKRKWDTNAITPGTPFMAGLARALRYWVAYKLATDPGWKDLQVIISDATVPGEGEHKIMSFIRSQRLDPEYDPNTRHCIYGLDADLIFLGLATHEPHFRVLREDVFAQGGNRMRVRDQLLMTAEQKQAIDAQDAQKPFLWLHVNVLREYLEVELNLKMLMQWDLERAIDDWVFMCFFVGNDFLPHFPSLSVRDNGIDILVQCWKQVIPKLRDFITCDGKLNLEGVEQLLAALALKEDGIFRKRHENERRYQHHDKRRQVGRAEEASLRKQYLLTVSKGKEKAPIVADTNMPLMDTLGKIVEGFAQLTNKDIVHNRGTITQANMANADAANALKKLLAEKLGQAEPETEAQSEIQSEQPSENPSDLDRKRTASDMETTESSETDEDGDDVRNWEAGYRERYYKRKFNAETPEEMQKIQKEVARAYLEGISWVLLYYYQGCPSWQWYYPYHYAPFAADFTDVRDIVGEEGIKFETGQPFNPYEQLMAVLPAASGHTLPEIFRDLMSNPESEIIDFYPEDFQIDMNGAKMAWQGIALLPFIDESRLLSAVRGQYHLLTDDERERNTNKEAQLYISSENKNYKKFNEEFADEKPVAFYGHKTGLAGEVKPVKLFSADETLVCPLSEGDMPDIENSQFLQTWYNFPKTTPGKSMLLNGYIGHVPVLNDGDKYNITNSLRPQRNFNRFRNTSDYVNHGPAGKKNFMVFGMRPGGYRAAMKMQSDGQTQRNQGNQYGNQYRNGTGTGNGNYGNGGYNRGGNRGNYNNRNGYDNGHQNGYNNGYNQNQNYNNGYNGNLGYNNGGYNGNQGYSNNQNQIYNQGYNQNQNYNQGYNNYNQNQGYNNYNQNQGFNNHNQNSRNQSGYNQYGNQSGYNSGSYNQNQRSGYMPPRR